MNEKIRTLRSKRVKNQSLDLLDAVPSGTVSDVEPLRDLVYRDLPLLVEPSDIRLLVFGTGPAFGWGSPPPYLFRLEVLGAHVRLELREAGHKAENRPPRGVGVLICSLPAFFEHAGRYGWYRFGIERGAGRIGLSR